MSEKDPVKDPFRWFLNASLLMLFSAVALTLAVQLLSQIWIWILLIAGTAACVGIGVAIWQARRRPW
ncbi:hypothetical protein [Nocardia nova]